MKRLTGYFSSSVPSIVSFIKKNMPQVYSYIYNTGAKGESERAAKSRKQMEDAFFVHNHEIGSPIIASPNEYDDLIIGFVVAHEVISKANRPIAIVYDYVRDKELMLLPRAYPFSESFARNVSNLHPSDRHVLFYGREKSFSAINESTIIGWENMEKRLKENGFFEKLNSYTNAVKEISKSSAK